MYLRPLLALALLPALLQCQTNVKVEWIARNIVSIRSIEPKDEDFSDLQALKQSIGAARIVQLGGQNTSLEEVKAKHRLVRFLHQELDFDVLASDAPVFDAYSVDRALDTRSAINRDLELSVLESFSWQVDGSMVPQSRDVLDYVIATHKNPKPLHLTGFGLHTSRATQREFVNELFAFIDRVDPSLATSDERKAIKRMMQWVPGTEAAGWNQGAAAILAVDKRLEEISFASPAAREAAVLIQVLWTVLYHHVSMQAADPSRITIPPPNNAVWLVKDARPHSKIIIWSNNPSIARNPNRDRPATLTGDRRRAPVERTVNGWPVTTPLIGDDIAKALPGTAFAIGVSVLRKDGDVELPAEGPAMVLSSYSLESLLHAAGKPYLYVGLRAIPKDHWLNEPIPASLLSPSEGAIWPDHFDAVLYLDLVQAGSKKRK